MNNFKSAFTYSKSEIDNHIARIANENPTMSFASFSDTNGLSIYFTDENFTKHRFSDHPFSDDKGCIQHDLVKKSEIKRNPLTGKRI